MQAIRIWEASDGGWTRRLACTREVDCLSGNCVDGVCCDFVCAGICERCDIEGAEGTCSAVPDGTSCANSDLCDGEETCDLGKCQEGQPLTCQDQHTCTLDTCNPVSGCDFQPVAVECDDNDLCTRDICDVQVGCRYEDMPDGTTCGDCTICQAGNCSRDPSCDGDSGCLTAQRGHPDWPELFLLLSLVWIFNRARKSSADR